jgi:diguanylate cyclase (GGDEF)-like protein
MAQNSATSPVDTARYPPLAERPARRLPPVIGRVDGASAWLLTAGGLLCVGLIALLDYETGPALSLSIFYLIPVGICAWWAGFSHGILLSLAGAVAWSLVDSLENPALTAPIGLWNGIVRCGTLVIISSLVSRVHAGAMRERLLARTDALTGAANGRTFYEAVLFESERAARSGRPLTMAYLDLDDFKRLNDERGHAAGDAALVDLVNLIRPSLRSTDVIARLGGDEFALLLPETDATGAVAALTRMQLTLADEMARTGRALTVSIGAVTFLSPVWDVDRMVQQVDTLMYAAKRLGKNRVEHVTVRDAGDLKIGDRLRLERRAGARSVSHHSARVRREGEGVDEEVPASVHDVSCDGIALRTERRFDEGCVLIVEPFAKRGQTLLARVARATPDAGGWLHGCELATAMSAEELQCWLDIEPRECDV